MHYRTNWLVVILLALGLHGAVFGGLILARPLLDGSAEEVASEVGTTIELEDAPQSGEGEETKDPGYEDGAEGGSLVGEALPGKGLENIKAADISNEPAAETDIVKVMEERENPPPDTEPEPLEEAEADVPEEKADTEPIVAENEKDAVKKFQKQVEDAKKDPKKKISSTIVVKKKGDGSTHTMGQPPKIIVDSYPPEGMYTFKGVVRVFATIGEDGKIKQTKVAVTSGRRGVDELAMAFCRRWTFKPALDSKGQPMECVKLIRIPFNLPPEKMKDQIDRNT